MGSTEISAQLLHELLTYDTATGNLYWKPRPREMFATERAWKSWTARCAGAEALGADNGKGYKFGFVLRQRIYAHRAAWCLTYGSFPENEIDHIDRDRGNNRINNLRDIPHKDNCANRGISARNTSGYTHVSWDRHRGKWTVLCPGSDGRPKRLGRFDHKLRAVAARDAFLASV